MEKWKSTIIIKAKTWKRDTHGLYDYENNNDEEQVLKTSSSVRIVRFNDSIRLLNDLSHKKKLPEQAKTLGYLLEKDGNFVLSRENGLHHLQKQQVRENFWLAVKSIKTYDNDTGYLLKKNDLIKLGRAKFRIREIYPGKVFQEDGMAIKSFAKELPSQSFNADQEENLNFLNQYKVTIMPENSDINCRICLHNDNQVENALVSPCGCSGSVKYVHINCLKQWIKSNCVTKSSGICTQYSWKNIRCELCNKSFPDVFVNNEKIEELIDIPKQPSNSILLESIPKKDQISKTFYSLSILQKSVVRLGRGHDVDVRINDLSISRFHASISQSFGNFFLHDNGSKFGTLVFLKNDMRLSSDQSPLVQMGRSLFSFQIFGKKKISTFQEETPAMQTIANNTQIQIEPEPFTSTGENLEFSFLNNNIFNNTRNVFERNAPIFPQANNFNAFTAQPTRNSVFNPNIFNLSLPVDRIIPQNNSNFLNQQIRQSNLGGVFQDQQGRIKRNTIIRELENLGINDDNEEQNNKNDRMNSSKYHFHEEK